MTSILLSVQSGSIPTGQGQGYRQLRSSQVTGQRSAQLGDRDQLPVLLSTQSSTMASGQEIIPIGEACYGGFPGTPPGPSRLSERTHGDTTRETRILNNRLQITKCATL